MILLINICKEKLHFHEFVKPVGKVLIKNGIKGFIRHYTCVTKKDLEKANKVNICGTSLADFGYVNNLDKFRWLKDFDKPVLGICGGMQIILGVFGIKLDAKKMIGMNTVVFSKNFLGLSGNVKGYHLHQVGTNKVGRVFDVYAKSNSGIQAVKHKEKEIYGVLFHPEVRHEGLIREFVEI